VTSFNFGQPDNGIIQMAYIVPDIHAAMHQWSTDLRVGPWFLLDHFSGVDPIYRGARPLLMSPWRWATPGTCRSS
jgi:hypothetical protein